MKNIILYTLLYVAFFIFGAYATTDILRLLHGCTSPVNAPGCYCPSCNKKIPLSAQIPVFSYIRNKGACQNCHAPIPLSDLFLELFIGFGFSIIATILHFSWLSFGLCICLYEATKGFYMLYAGVRKQAFFCNFFRSLFNNLILFSLLGILFALCHLSIQ